MPSAQSAQNLLPQKDAYHDDVRMNTSKGLTLGSQDVYMATARGQTYGDVTMDMARDGTKSKQVGLQLWERELLESSEVKRKATVAQLCESRRPAPHARCHFVV